jgi:CubicO group peptidase (beta-lactamase class C family)
MGALSPARLRRLDDVLAGYVARGEVPGLVAAVSRHGEEHVTVLGEQAFGGPPMRRDTLFRISSMTKPVLAVAAMTLVEECRLRLDDPVTGLVPELADRRVLTRLDAPLHDTVPAHRDITTRDLLTLRLGFGFVFGPAADYPILAAAHERELGMGPPSPASLPPPDEWLSRFAELPLMYQPGERWTYEMGFAVLGVLVARAAGQPLERFLVDRLFAPLRMPDTGFSVPALELYRLASCYHRNPESGGLELFDDGEDSQWSRPPAFPDGRGGLVSSVDDYLAFGRMLLRAGRGVDERILSRPSVRLMTTDQLTSAQKAASPNASVFLGSLGWGFGMAVVTQRDDVAAVPGQFGWDGGLGTLWRTDPAEDLVIVLMSQTVPPCWSLFSDFRTLAYQAIDD